MNGGGQQRARSARAVTFRGQALDRRDFARIERLARRHAERTRRELAEAVCRAYGWRRANGALPTRSCRELLLRLDRWRLIELPESQQRASAQAASSAVSERTPWPEVTSASGGALRARAGAVVVRPIAAEEYTSWQGHMAQFHYLGCGALVGESLRQAAFLDGRVVALLGWSGAALHNGPRDRYLGWDAATKRAYLAFVVNNARFLMLPWADQRNLATQVLAGALRRLSGDWQRAYGHPVWLAETFVDTTRFHGGCYRAGNWTYLGETRGYGRESGGRYSAHGVPKAVFIYALHRRARVWLGRRPEPTFGQTRGGGDGLNVEALPLEGEDGLFEVLERITDHRKRRGIRHNLASILAVSLCAVLGGGARSYEAIAQWAEDQSDSLLRRLRCRKRAPSEPTIRRELGRVDVEEVDREIGQWLARRGLSPAEATALDGKTVRGSGDGETGPAHLLGAVVHDAGVVVAQTDVGDKTNEITCVEPLLGAVDIAGKVITADALHTQRATAEYLVAQRGADYLFTVKDNQPTLRKDIADLFDDQQRRAEKRHTARDLPGEAFPP